MELQPYLYLNGRCEEAITAWTAALGATVETMMRFRDGPPGHVTCEVDADKIMHARIRIGDAAVMLSDGRPGSTPHFDGFSLSLATDDDARGRAMFEALADGGTIEMALAPTFYARLFGMVTDRFGVGWMIMVGG